MSDAYDISLKQRIEIAKDLIKRGYIHTDEDIDDLFDGDSATAYGIRRTMRILEYKYPRKTYKDTKIDILWARNGESNPFYNPYKSIDGGGYHQPVYFAEVSLNGLIASVYYANTSCGGFGTRYTLCVMDGTLPEHKSGNLYHYFLDGKAKKVWVMWGSMIDDSKASIRRSIYDLEDRYKVDTNNLIKAVVNA